ncbi:MAG: DMT family transporter [Muribaculaceae bacterium]|nr:DMT family transporter [Muribaculaceae bacterium]MDE5713896.1 DMT family transporter [Muribaculaceae bacterium]
MSNKAKGFFIGAIAAASYGTNPLFALPLYKEGMNPDSVLFFRYLLAIPIMGIMLLCRRGKNEFKINPRQTMQLFLMGILLAFSSLSLFLSYTYMDAGIASTLLFVYPIMVALIMAIGFKEKFTVSTGICIIMALVGIGLLYKNSDGTTISLLGTVLVMTSSLTYAIYIVGVNQTKLRNMPTLKVIFYVLIFGVSVFLCRIVLLDSLVLPQSPVSWANLLGLAILPTAVSFLCTTSAIQLIGPTPTAILGALEPLTAVVIGVAVFGEVLTPRIALGIILILLAVSIVVAGGNFAKQLTNIKKLFPRKIK